MRKNHRDRNTHIICIIILSWITISFCLEVSPLNLQALKFPPSIIYGLASLISIVASLFCKGRIDKYVNNKIINYIGTNAIWFYFCQGIGGSSLYYILPYFNLPWWGKLIIAFLINFCITFFCTMIVKHFYEFCINPIKRVKSVLCERFSNMIIPWNN